MFREATDPFEKSMRHGGYNLAFFRRVQARRRGLLAKDKVAPGLVHDEFKRGKIPKSESARQLRHALVIKAKEIHLATSRLKPDPDDIDRAPVEIIKRVCDRHGVTLFAIRGKCRAAFLAAVRHQAIVRVYLARPKASLPEIGRWFDLDHTTILSAVRKSGLYTPRLELYRGKHQSAQ